MPDLQALLDQIDRLQATHQEVSDAAQVGDIGAMINLEDNYNHQCVNLAPQLAKALQAVINTCEDIENTVHRDHTYRTEYDYGMRAQSRAVIEEITDALGADDVD